MVLKITKQTLIFLQIISALVWADKSIAQSNKAPPNPIQNDVERLLEVLHVDHLDDHRIRIYLSATELSGGVPYPISTIERNMVKVEFTNTSTPPADPHSLTVLGSQLGQLKRALFVGFNLDTNLTGRELTEIRTRVSELINELPSEYLSVAAIAQGSARMIMDATPEERDNINKVEQLLAALPAEGEGSATTDILCVAAEKFHSWSTDSFKPSDQKVLLILSPPGDSRKSDKLRTANCFRSLIDQKVRVIQVAIGSGESKSNSFDLIAATKESQGYVHFAKSSIDILPAVKNVIALLRNEYAIDVDAPDISLEDQPLELRVKVQYHDTPISSLVHNLGFIIPSLAKVFSISENSPSRSTDANINDEIDRERKRLFIIWSLIILMGIGLIFGGYTHIAHRLKTVSCNTCDRRVLKNHSDCPFRNKASVARLVFVDGPKAGMTLPLVKGTNVISALGSKNVRLPFGGVSLFNHGQLIVDSTKIIYQPTRPGKDLLNGWPVREPKLMGQGHILRLGRHKLRLEVKPQFEFG